MEPLHSHRVVTAPRGFTLIEMLVVLVIIIIITAIALSGQSQFNRTEALNNETYNIALSIRQAQYYGLTSFHSFANTSSSTPPYGVDFTNTPVTTYTFFADTDPLPGANKQTPDAQPGDGKYKSASDSPIQTYTLNNGFTIKTFCVVDTSAPANVYCSTDSTPLTKIDITFARPNADTTIQGRQGSSTWISQTLQFACFKLLSPSNEYRYITVSLGGQVQAGSAVTDTTCTSHL